MHTFNTENVSTPTLTESAVLNLISHRNSYAYPKAYIRFCDRDNADLAVGNLQAQFVCPSVGEVTDSWLDCYHHNLLHSDRPSDRLLGLASIVFWGFYTFGDSYSKNRVIWLLEGRGQYGPTTAEIAMDKTNMANIALASGNMSQAISSLHGISQLNQMPFASKVIAFMAPSIAGVLDNRISDGLRSESWADNLSCNIGTISSRSKSRGFQSWCQWLLLIASQLNLGIEHGKHWSWTDADGRPNSWRAIDVERALFSMYAA